MQAGDVGPREHTVSMWFTCLAQRHALSRLFTLRLRRPAPSGARIRASGRRLQLRWCKPNSTSSRQSPMALAWGFRSADQSSNHMVGHLWVSPRALHGTALRFTLPIRVEM